MAPPYASAENKTSKISFSVERIDHELAMEAYASRNSPDSVQTDVLLQARDSCYKARDAFYACLEKEAGKKPTEIASVGLLYPAECKKVRVEFVNHCRNSWVKHFDRQYCKNKRVQRLLDDGAETRRDVIYSICETCGHCSVSFEGCKACFGF